MMYSPEFEEFMNKHLSKDLVKESDGKLTKEEKRRRKNVKNKIRRGNIKEQKKKK